MMTDFTGKVALVTGGGSGIGRGLVLALADEGASVVVVDLLQERADEVAAEVEKAGATAVALSCDVSDRAAVKKMKAEANEALGPVSLLFANAGVTWFDDLVRMTDEAVDWVIHVNLMGTLYCMQAFLPDMIEAREGHVVATASNAGLITWVPYHVPYTTAKAGIIGMMMNLRWELEEYNVGSTVYCPGGVRGRIADSVNFRPAKFGGPTEGGVNFERLDMEWSKENIAGGYEAEDVAPFVLDAVKANDPIVVDHANHRKYFEQHYLAHVTAAFDKAEAWEVTHPMRDLDRPA